jgi:hypothetical protein
VFRGDDSVTGKNEFAGLIIPAHFKQFQRCEAHDRVMGVAQNDTMRLVVKVLLESSPTGILIAGRINLEHPIDID